MRLGAQSLNDGTVRFRVWAPDHSRVSVVFENGISGDVALAASRHGWFEGTVAVEHPILYRYRLDGGEAYADPASRYQPEGPHGPSQVIDPLSFAGTDGLWRGPMHAKHELYEMQVGTFTQEGTWRSAARAFDEAMKQLEG